LVRKKSSINFKKRQSSFVEVRRKELSDSGPSSKTKASHLSTPVLEKGVPTEERCRLTSKTPSTKRLKGGLTEGVIFQSGRDRATYKGGKDLTFNWRAPSFLPYGSASLLDWVERDFRQASYRTPKKGTSTPVRGKGGGGRRGGFHRNREKTGILLRRSRKV